MLDAEKDAHGASFLFFLARVPMSYEKCGIYENKYRRSQSSRQWQSENAERL
jgi:hypothetical protein